MINFLCNAFNDPSDPWYYVIGVLFLLLVFGAIAVYVIFSGKKKKQDGADKQDQAADSAEAPVRDESTEGSTVDVNEQDKE